MPLPSISRASEILAAVFAALAVGGEALAWRPNETLKVVGLLLLLSIALRLKRGEPPGTVPPAFWPWATMAALGASSLAWSADPGATLRVSKHLGQEVLLCAGLAVCPRRERLLQSLAVGAATGAMVLAAGYLAAWLLGDARGGRIALWDGDGNQQGRAIALGLVLGLLSVRGRALLLAVVPGLALGLTGSRGAWLGVAPALGLLALRPPLRRSGQRVSAVLALAALVAGATALVLRPDVRSPLPAESREALTSGRDAIWANTIEIIRDHPAIGVGAGAVPAVYDPYYLAREARGGLHSKPRRDPHNHYLQLLAETGPAGLGLFLLGLLLVLVDARQRLGPSRRALPVVLLLAIGCMTVTAIEQRVFWLGLAWAALAAGAQPEPPLTVPGRRVIPPERRGP